MKTNERFWALEPSGADTVLRALWMGTHPEPGAELKAPTEAGPVEVDTVDGIAVVSVGGALARNTQYAWYGDIAAVGYDAIGARLEALASDPAVKGVLLDIDSPGGTVAGLQELADRIKALSAKKPMAAFTNSLMASAAYWIGSATGCVYATQSAEVGSIGVVMMLMDCTEHNRKAGLNVHVIASGRMKAAGSPYKELSDEERAEFQQQADDLCGIFKQSVAGSMGLGLETAEDWAEGRVFIGSKANDNGLVTAVVSGRDEAITLLKEKAKMDKQSIEAQAPEIAEAFRAEGEERAKAKTVSNAQFLGLLEGFMSAEDYAFAAMLAEKAGRIGFDDLADFAKAYAPKGKAMAQAQAAGEAVQAEAAQQAAAPAAAEAEAEAKAKADEEKEFRARLLEAMIAAGNRAVASAKPAANPLTPRDALLKSAERIGA